MNPIPFVKPSIGPAEKEAVLRALEMGAIGGNGRLTQQVRERMKSLFGVRHVILTTSCSDALELAMMVLNVGPGDEVIMPSFTFVSTANAVVRQGGVPVFVDIEPDTWNIDPAQIEPAITDRTRGIIPVHYAGQGCRMDEINEIARRHGLWVVEDAAQGVGAFYDDKPLGTWGTIGCYSFHVTKNITCGEGGALLTDDDDLGYRAEIIAEKGTNRSAFLRGQVDKYTWVDIGSSFILSDLLVALLSVQLDRMEEITARRVAIWERFQRELQDLEDAELIVRMRVRPPARINGHIFAFRTVNPEWRDPVLGELRRRGIEATFHYVPLHSAPYARGRFQNGRELPVTDLISRSLIRLPIFPDMTEAEQTYIVENVHDIFKRLA
jgi:dTDP-4-amino-4,6-dideoxygalactose transaminase